MCIHPSVNVRLYSEAPVKGKTFFTSFEICYLILKVEVILFYHRICEVLVGGMKAYKWHVISFDFSKYDSQCFFLENEVPFCTERNSFRIWNEDIKDHAMFKSNSNQRNFNIPLVTYCTFNINEEKKNFTQPAHVWATCSFNSRLLVKNVC